MPESITATSTRLPVGELMRLRQVEPLRRMLVGIHLRQRALRQREQIVRLRTRDLRLACHAADHVGHAGAAVDPPAEQPAPGEPEGLRLHPGHRMAARDGVELRLRHARRDVEDHLVGPRTGAPGGGRFKSLPRGVV